MRKTLQIFVLVLLYLVFTAKSCDNQGNDIDNNARISLIQDSLASTFVSAVLSDNSLRAFENMAKIKLSDFNDYLAIANDTSIAGPFREKAREMIRGIFISENPVLQLSDFSNSGERNFPVKQLLEEKAGSLAAFGKIMPDSIWLKQSLQQTCDSVYTGKLGFIYLPAGKQDANVQDQAFPGGTVGFILAKRYKQFGTKTLLVWDVFLGNMK